MGNLSGEPERLELSESSVGGRCYFDQYNGVSFRWEALKVLSKDQVDVAILIQKAFDTVMAVTKGINGRQKDVDDLKDALSKSLCPSMS